ncbi:hypothetical protein [uncultured Microbacterium sp.]|uniref:hypothetical protein n=1 Tax=uncultured Microbacterium sp. TaxID=191216 RepID=UPI0025EE565A|nr:hypothetical protein [uncultured Microbacterium sp.]
MLSAARSPVAARTVAPDGRTFRPRIEGADAETRRLVDLLDDAGGAQTLDGDGFEVTLDGYGYRWWRVIRPGERRIA